MKKIIYSMLFVVAALTLSGCQKESAGTTGYVDYVVLKLLGDKQVTLALNETYVEAGYTATDKGNDVSGTVAISIVDMMGDEVEDIDTSSPGIFTIYYSAVSEDNVPITVTRLVMVYDPTLTASIEGDWSVDYDNSVRWIGGVDDEGNPLGSTWAEWSEYYTSDAWAYSAYSMKKYTLTFTEIVPGIYECQDLLGGFYTGLRGYGPYYAENVGDDYFNYYSMNGMVLLSADMSISLISSSIEAWGDGLDDLEGTLDDVNKVLTLHAYYAGMDFNTVSNLAE